jgi:hypothetical protein
MMFQNSTKSGIFQRCNPVDREQHTLATVSADWRICSKNSLFADISAHKGGGKLAEEVHRPLKSQFNTRVSGLPDTLQNAVH